MNEDDDEGVSDTWENDKDSDTELEDGEIQAGDPVDVAGNENTVTVENSESQDLNVREGEPPILENGINVDNEHAENSKLAPEMIKETPTMINENIGKVNINANGLLEKLVPSGCFGPFPSFGRPNSLVISPTRENEASGPIRGTGRSHLQGSGVKRRRVDDSVYNSLPCRMLFGENENENEIDDDRRNIVGSAPVDLNFAPETSSTIDGSYSDEVQATITVGNQIGFQIEDGNEILNEVMGATGGQIDHQ
ncbi:hypothetical protein L2E82_45098 [Cichorium intybus]|uniref:Uncharacterized protein n=1 Tax=Cichorium intybus TaxID=13427 RepID=A0ACB8ZS64_CICIN|nr:hypothetical protein L2E82_45098 [Cichorium intybus]